MMYSRGRSDQVHVIRVWQGVAQVNALHSVLDEYLPRTVLCRLPYAYGCVAMHVSYTTICRSLDPNNANVIRVCPSVVKGNALHSVLDEQHPRDE